MKETPQALEMIKELLEYRDGALYWRVGRKGTPAGARAGRLSGGNKNNGHYRQVCVNRVYFYEHRIVWAFHNGSWPDGDVDHIDHNKLNNSIENLRVVSRRDNLLRIEARKNNHSGAFGVRKIGSRFVARVWNLGKEIYVGSYKTLNDAVEARNKYMESVNG